VPADLIIYALVAAGLIFWLRSILGTRHGDERQRPNIYSAHAESLREGAAPARAIPGEEFIAGPEERIRELAKAAQGVMAVGNSAAESGLLEIARQDKSFEIKAFLTGAQDAFAIIVESFGDGDRETLQNLLAPNVYKAFEAAIAAREQRSETQKTEIHAIRKVEVTAARVQDKTAYITVRFHADETSVTRDKNGEIIAGHPERTTEMRDIWEFGRPLKSRDPRWLVYETRSDFEGDNDLIPNTQ
jgi:predicted lipid-binding transport protein (Tim44 family)